MELLYFGKLDNSKIFFCEADIEKINGLEWIDMHVARKNLKKTDLFTLSVVFHFNDWYSKNRFCGRCGLKTKKHDHELALQCKSCGNIIYPRISPVVIVGEGIQRKGNGNERRVR